MDLIVDLILLNTWWNISSKLSKHFISTRLMLIVAEVSQEYSEPFQTSKMNIFAEINGCKDDFKTLSNC